MPGVWSGHGGSRPEKTSLWNQVTAQGARVCQPTWMLRLPQAQRAPQDCRASGELWHSPDMVGIGLSLPADEAVTSSGMTPLPLVSEQPLSRVSPHQQRGVTHPGAAL